MSVKINENSKCAAITCNKKVANGVICVLCSAAYHSKCAIAAGNPNADETLAFWTCVKCVPNTDAARRIVDLLHTATSLYRENCIYEKLVNIMRSNIDLMRAEVVNDNENTKTNAMEE